MADEELDALAAEFALGTLDGEERRAFLQRLAHDPAAVAALRGWEERLAPLALGLPEVAPPAELYARIERSLDAQPIRLPAAANDNRVARWRMATVAAALLALVAGGLALRTPAPMPAAVPVQPVALTGAIAALSKGGGEPALVVTFDRGSGRLHVIPVNLPADTLHSLELWAIRGKAAPAPVGLIDAARPTSHGTRFAPADDVTLAVSREPVGGSPTGAPTGPVLFTGKLVTLPTT